MVPPAVVARAGELERLPQARAVYLIWPREGRPHLGRTNMLRRRLLRLFERWALEAVAERVEYWLAGSRLEQWQVSYQLARQHFPEEYQRMLRLPRPSYVRLVLNNEFPRTQVTTRLGGRGVSFGPFGSRALAEQFEGEMLDLFQLRRCQEDLTPSPEHPGCIYGEMQKCLRPCQQAVSVEEYASEAGRVREFLTQRGARLLEAAALAREQASEELDFETAAREHARYERVQAVVRGAGELPRDVERLDGVAVTASVEPMNVELWFMRGGMWTGARRFSVAPVGGKPVSLDARLKELVAGVEVVPGTVLERQEHLGLLAKWYYSSWRDGEWLAIDSWAEAPYRKLVNAIHRVARGTSGATGW